ncbi:MAG: LOG family protein [Patescibacteria group bacterium]
MTKTQITIPSIKESCNIKKVAIFGSADVDEKHPLFQEVFKIARFLAYNGKTVVNGGGPGTMLAATLGAESVGGDTVAVTLNPVDMPEFEGVDGGNKVDKEIKATNYIERMFGLMDESDAFICVQGGTGTLSEWATAWLLGHLYYGNHKPLILYGDFWHEVMRVMGEYFFIGEKEHEVYKIVRDEDELIAALNEFETELATRCRLPSEEETE